MAEMHQQFAQAPNFVNCPDFSVKVPDGEADHRNLRGYG